MSENENKTYELCYNSACISIGKENLKEAYDKLKKAETMCVETFEDEQEDQEALDNEIAIIRIQLGYCLQKLGKHDDALKLYKNLIKTKLVYARVYYTSAYSTKHGNLFKTVGSSLDGCYFQ